MTRLNQVGSHIIALAVGVLVIAGIGFAGYHVMRVNNQATTVSSSKMTTAAPQTITTKADLVQTGKALDSSSTQLDNSLNDASLNGDLNSLL